MGLDGVTSSQRSKRNQTVYLEKRRRRRRSRLAFGTPLVDFQPQFSLHKAGNSQRGGCPWLLIYSHAVVLLGLCLGTEWSTIKQKLRLVTAAPVHLNKHLNDKTPPRRWDQSPASILMCGCAGESLVTFYWSPSSDATTSPRKRQKPTSSWSKDNTERSRKLQVGAWTARVL